jgi:hypothetical protein
MKTLLPKLLKYRVVQAGGLLALIAAVAVPIAWSRPPEARVRLGGAWVGQLGGIQWISIHTPLDPEAATAVGRLQWVTINAQYQGLLGALGAETLSEASGTYQLISNTTAKYNLVFYAVAKGTASPTTPQAGQIKAIFVMTGTWHYTGPFSAESQETLAAYLPDGDPEHNVLPGPDAEPFLSATYPPHPQHRIPAP